MVEGETMTNQVRIYVSPNFKRTLKKQAADKDISIIELTRRISDDSNGFQKHFQKIRKGDTFEI